MGNFSPSPPKQFRVCVCVWGGGLKFPTEGSKGKDKKKKKKRGKLVKIAGFNLKFFKNFSKFRRASPPEPHFVFSILLFFLLMERFSCDFMGLSGF